MRIKLDADFLAIPESLNEMQQREYWWGPHYSENKFSQQYGVAVHGPTKYDVTDNLIRTEFWWYGKAERTFEAEELVDRPLVSDKNGLLRSVRFVHSIFSSESTSRHLDDMRLYSDSLWNEHFRTQHCDVWKAAKRRKLWRIDGALNVTQWYELIHMFFRGNFTIAEYFGLPDPATFRRDSEREVTGLLRFAKRLANHKNLREAAGPDFRLTQEGEAGLLDHADRCRIQGICRGEQEFLIQLIQGIVHDRPGGLGGVALPPLGMSQNPGGLEPTPPVEFGHAGRERTDEYRPSAWA